MFPVYPFLLRELVNVLSNAGDSQSHVLPVHPFLQVKYFSLSENWLMCYLMVLIAAEQQFRLSIPFAAGGYQTILALIANLSFSTRLLDWLILSKIGASHWSEFDIRPY